MFRKSRLLAACLSAFAAVASASVLGAQTLPAGFRVSATPFTLRVSSAGPGSASGVAVKDALADRVSFLSAAATKGSCSYASATRTVSCSIGSMAAGEAVTASIHAIAGGKGQIDNTGTVSAGVPDPNPGNNSSSIHLKPK